MQPAQGAEVLAELPHEIVDQGPDGRTRPQVIMRDPEVSVLSEGQVKSPTVRGTGLATHLPTGGAASYSSYEASTARFLNSDPPPDTTEGTVGGPQLDRETGRWVHPIVYLPLYPGLGL